MTSTKAEGQAGIDERLTTRNLGLLCSLAPVWFWPFDWLNGLQHRATASLMSNGKKKSSTVCVTILNSSK